MKVGNYVKNPNSWSYLACGGGVYDVAIVMSVEPLVCVSEETDMRWDRLDKNRLSVVGSARMPTVLRCLCRLSFKEKLKFLKDYFL